MFDRKEEIVRAVQAAKSEIENALATLEETPSFDANCVRYAAHTLHNYLTVTIGVAELLKEKLADHPDREVKLWPNLITQAGNLMTQTIHQLTNVAPLPKGSYLKRDVLFPGAISRCCEYYQVVAANKKIKLHLETKENCPVIYSDHVAIAAVMDNLLSNAVKYSPKGERIDVEVDHNQSEVICRVRDKGQGLSKEDQARLYHRGVRLTPQPTGNEMSTGYGLAIVKEILTELGGRIWCESEVGQGTQFTFAIPIGEPKK